jgi:hypothetical protein
MGLRFEIDEGERLVRLRADVRPSLDEWFAVMDAVFADTRYRPGVDFLLDRTAVTDVPTSQTMREWMRRHAESMREQGSGRLAVVVSEPVVFGMMRMASVFAEEGGTALGVFWTEAEALAWFGRA